MKKHTKIYLRFFDYGEHPDVFIPCEICASIDIETRAVDIHHLDPRRMGGSKLKDDIENLIGVCRVHHIRCENDPGFNDRAKVIHLKFMEDHA